MSEMPQINENRYLLKDTAFPMGVMACSCATWAKVERPKFINSFLSISPSKMRTLESQGANSIEKCNENDLLSLSEEDAYSLAKWSSTLGI